MSRSHRDNIEINQHEHDEELEAKRVVIVGGEFKLDTDKISKSLETALSKATFDFGPLGKSEVTTNSVEVQVIKVPEIVKETEIKVVEVPIQTFVPQIQIVEVPKIVIETKIIEVEKPVIIEKIQTVYIDKPIVGETVYKTNKFSIALLAISILANIALCYKLFIN